MENQRLIQERAWSFYRTTGMDYKELYSEACLLYFLALSRFEENKKTKLSTFCYTFITNGLISFIKKERQQITYNSLDLENYMETAWETITKETIKLSYEKVPVDVQTILSFINDNDILFNSLPPRKIRGLLVKYLREIGWAWKRVWDGIKETKCFVLDKKNYTIQENFLVKN